MADEQLAQQLIDHAMARAGLGRDWEQQLPTLAADGAEHAALQTGVEHALARAPWSAELNYLHAAVLTAADPLAALAPVIEAIRLDWRLAGAHRLLARILGLVGAERDAANEVEIARLLMDGQQLEAADVRLGSM
jgi:hypothetical protein